MGVKIFNWSLICSDLGGLCMLHFVDSDWLFVDSRIMLMSGP